MPDPTSLYEFDFAEIIGHLSLSDALSFDEPVPSESENCGTDDGITRNQHIQLIDSKYFIH